MEIIELKTFQLYVFDVHTGWADSFAFVYTENLSLKNCVITLEHDQLLKL